MLDFFTSEELNERLAEPIPYDRPRAITGAAEQINVQSGRDRVDKREASAWQIAAWQFYDAIGELKFAFNLMGQVVSRVRIFAAAVENPNMPPIEATDFIAKSEDAELKKAAEAAHTWVEDFKSRAATSISSLLRESAINMCVPGEFYVLDHEDKWQIASSEELVRQGQNYSLKQDRTSSSPKKDLGKDTFIARMWRSHPRFSHEPDSSMLGILDSCEEVILLDQARRVITRSRLNAGALFIPDGVGADDVETAITDAVTKPASDESAATSIVPILLRGPADLGKEIKFIDMSRRVDSEMLEQQSRALDRVLAGADIPKDLVAGLSEVRYSNAVVITDTLYTSHIEPLVLMVVDAFTSVLLRNYLRKNKFSEDVISKIVIWYDPSDVVTRPDRSQAANDGYDRKELSGKAWREARGFTEYDKPTKEELIYRLALEATVPPEMAAAMIESLNPDFFQKTRDDAQASSDMPPEIESLVDPSSTAHGASAEASGQDLSGGEVTQGGSMPPDTRPPR